MLRIVPKINKILTLVQFGYLPYFRAKLIIKHAHYSFKTQHIPAV